MGKGSRPRIAITIGDAAGIGPEVVLRSLAENQIFDSADIIVVGDARHLVQASKRFGLEEVLNSGRFSIEDLGNLPADIEYGENSADTGRASGEYIVRAVDLWREGKVDGIVTAPINKLSLGSGGFQHIGHTEFLAELTGTERFAMSFFAERLRVVLLSTHLPLRDAIERVKRPAIADLVRFVDTTLSGLLRRRVTLAVAGLNPHAGEGGMFGSEEIEEISPAIEECRAEGINVSGPFSPDTIFVRCYQGEFDACIALYHDQATIPVKSLAFSSGVNVTLGLPLVRTSVDHGTAFDIAGKGIADPSSMKSAIGLAVELCAERDE